MALPIFLQQYESKPIKHKAIFKEHNIPLKVISDYIGRSYPHTSNVLNGLIKPSQVIEDRLDKLVNELRKVK